MIRDSNKRPSKFYSYMGNCAVRMYCRVHACCPMRMRQISEMRLAAAHIPRAQLPQILELNAIALPCRNVLHLLGNILLRRPLHVDVLQVAGGIVAADGLAEVVGPVGPRAVDEQRVEEDGVALLHVEVNTWVVLGAADPVVHLVHALLPVRVVVLLQHTLQKKEGFYYIREVNWCQKFSLSLRCLHYNFFEALKIQF